MNFAEFANSMSKLICRAVPTMDFNHHGRRNNSQKENMTESKSEHFGILSINLTLISLL